MPSMRAQVASRSATQPIWVFMTINISCVVYFETYAIELYRHFSLWIPIILRVPTLIKFSFWWLITSCQVVKEFTSSLVCGG